MPAYEQSRKGLKMQGIFNKINIKIYDIQCGDASHDSFKGDTEISYIETP